MSAHEIGHRQFLCNWRKKLEQKNHKRVPTCCTTGPSAEARAARHTTEDRGFQLPEGVAGKETGERDSRPEREAIARFLTKRQRIGALRAFRSQKSLESLDFLAYGGTVKRGDVSRYSRATDLQQTKAM